MPQKKKVACQFGWAAFTLYGVVLFCAGLLAGSSQERFEAGIGFVILVVSVLLVVSVWSIKATTEAHRAYISEEARSERKAA